MNISQFSKKYNISLDTLRFYEKINLLIPNRLGNGYRDYQCIHEQQIKTIICLKDLGFSLNEIQVMLHLNDSPPTQKCKDISNALLNKKIKDIDEKIKFFIYARNQLSEVSHFTQHNNYRENYEYIQNTISNLYELKTRT